MPASADPVLYAHSSAAFRRVDTRVIDVGPVAGYRIRVAFPAAKPGPDGYPVLLMLDGDVLEPIVLATAVSQDVLVVLVSHIAQGDLAKQARVFDYTPSLPGQPTPADPRVAHWLNGGADALLDLLEHDVLAWVKANYPVDATRITFYGHSYGGLCVLHALAIDTLNCARYVVVSPSVWWQNGAIVSEIAAMPSVVAKAADMLVLVGSREAWHAQPVGPDGSSDSRQGGASTVAAARDLSIQLNAVSGLRVAFDTIEGATHHTMLARSVMPALTFAGRAHDAIAATSLNKRVSS